MITFPYSQTLQASSGTPPFTWSVSSGTLPHNLSLGSASGTISGTPDQPQTETFTIQVQDSHGQTASRPYTVTIQNLVTLQMQELSTSLAPDTVEIQGLSAGPFNPSSWQQNTLNWVPDVRVPMLAPLTTSQWQNIYAPWALEQPKSWRLFYGGWDGADTPNDRIYSVNTSDFFSFQDRHLVIDHGILNHVNNANIHQLPDGSLHMLFGFQAAPNGLDRIAYVESPDGSTWNGSPEPYEAQTSDAISVQGDPLFGDSDYNGGNVLLREPNSWTLYYSKGMYGQGKNNVYRATSDSPPNFNAAGVALRSGYYANDVKKFQVQGQTWYLMALYYEAIVVGESPATFRYSLSTDGVTFTSERLLFGGVSAADKYPTTPSFVTQSGRVLGVLYGADPYDFLDAQDRIFARWLQKKVVIQDSSGNSYALEGGYGPDRQWFAATSGNIQGTMTVFAEDGITPLGIAAVNLAAGKSYQLIVP